MVKCGLVRKSVMNCSIRRCEHKVRNVIEPKGCGKSPGNVIFVEISQNSHLTGTSAQHLIESSNVPVSAIIPYIPTTVGCKGCSEESPRPELMNAMDQVEVIRRFNEEFFKKDKHRKRSMRKSNTPHYFGAHSSSPVAVKWNKNTKKSGRGR